jgi:hypothetical protein
MSACDLPSHLEGASFLISRKPGDAGAEMQRNIESLLAHQKRRSSHVTELDRRGT